MIRHYSSHRQGEHIWRDVDKSNQLLMISLEVPSSSFIAVLINFNLTETSLHPINDINFNHTCCIRVSRSGQCLGSIIHINVDMH